MKKIKIMIGTLLTLAFAFMLSACSYPFEEKNHDSLAAEIPAAAETKIPLSGEDAPPELCNDEPALAVEFGVERFIAQMDEDRIFTDAGDELASKVVFTAKRDIKDFRYLKISADYSGSGEMRVTERETLYALDEMNGGDVLAISIDLEGYLPLRAISYVDGCGGVHCFCVAIGGGDNIPVLVACRLPE